MKKLLSKEETVYTNLYDHIRRALIPVIRDDSIAVIRSYLGKTIARSHKIPANLKKGKIFNGSNNKVEMKSTGFEDSEGRPQKYLLLLTSVSEEQPIANLTRQRAG